MQLAFHKHINLSELSFDIDHCLVEYRKFANDLFQVRKLSKPLATHENISQMHEYVVNEDLIEEFIKWQKSCSLIVPRDTIAGRAFRILSTREKAIRNLHHTGTQAPWDIEAFFLRHAKLSTEAKLALRRRVEAEGFMVSLEPSLYLPLIESYLEKLPYPDLSLLLRRAGGQVVQLLTLETYGECVDAEEFSHVASQGENTEKCLSRLYKSKSHWQEQARKYPPESYCPGLDLKDLADENSTVDILVEFLYTRGRRYNEELGIFLKSKMLLI